MQNTENKKLITKLELLQEQVWNNEEKIKEHFVSIVNLESNLRKLNRAFIAVQDQVADLKKHLIQLNKKGGKND